MSELQMTLQVVSKSVHVCVTVLKVLDLLFTTTCPSTSNIVSGVINYKYSNGAPETQDNNE